MLVIIGGRGVSDSWRVWCWCLSHRENRAEQRDVG